MRIQVCFKKTHVILQKLNNTFKYMKDKQTGNTKKHAKHKAGFIFLHTNSGISMFKSGRYKSF